MPTIATSTIHHVARSVNFYTSLFGMTVAAEFPARVLLTNGTIIWAVGSAPNPSQASPNDRFSENRVGLDHISLSVATRAELDQAIALLDQHGIPHGEVVDYPPFSISVLAIRDPDNIQVELTAPIG